MRVMIALLRTTFSVKKKKLENYMTNRTNIKSIFNTNYFT